MYKTLCLSLMICLLAGCKELDLAPENSFTDLTFWTSEAKAQTVLNTAYSQMFSSNYFFFNEGLSDNAVNTRGDVEGAASLASGTYDASLPRIQQEWNSRYEGIKTCNILLENIDRIPDMDEAVRERMKAETRFLRAFQHFQLMSWFGDVSLLEQDPTIEEAQVISRTPRAQVLDFVLRELDAVMPLLPLNTALPAEEAGRITQGAALGLKARVLLYEGRWEEVLSVCEMLMSGEHGSYSLFPSYEGLFLPENENNSEIILSMQYVPQFRTWAQFFDMAPLSAGARLNNLAPTQELVNSYRMLNGQTIGEAGSGYNENDPYTNRDPRLHSTVVYDGYAWTGTDGNVQTIYIAPGTSPGEPLDEYAPGSSTSATGYYTRKYFDPTHTVGFASGLDLILIRYADILLMYAEASLELGQFNAGVWNETIGELRRRAGFTDPAALNFPAALSQEQLRAQLRNERRVELAMEGLRIFDIRRWQIGETVLNGWVHGARFGPASQDNGYLRVQQRSFDPSRHYLWPIPRDERNINPNLSQNPGWN